MRRRTPHGNNNGFTMVEVMIAIIVLAIAMGAVAITLGSTLRHSQGSTARSVAASVVSEEMEAVRQKARADFAALPQGTVTRTTKVGDVTYTVTRESTFVSENSTTDACTENNSSRAFLRVTVAVSWPAMNGAKPANAETLLTPPVGSYDPTLGHVAVKVRGRDAAGKPNVTVNLKKGATVVKTLETTSEGCAFFGYITPDAYTIELTEPGFVDGQNVATPTDSVTVTESAVVSKEFNYDARAALNITRVDATGSGSAIPQDASVVIAHPSLLPKGDKVFPHTGNGNQLISHIFPYAEGYALWVGDCADADPESKVPVDPLDPSSPLTQRYAGATRDAPVPLLPGYLTNAQVRLASQEIRVVDKDGDPEHNVRVRFVHDNDPESCTGGDLLVYDPTVDTDSDGRVRLALPLGKWEVQVLGRSPKGSGSWPEITIAPPYEAIRTTLTVEVD